MSKDEVTGEIGPGGFGRAILATLAVALLLGGCAGTPTGDGAPRGDVDVASIPDAVPRVESKSRFGNPRFYSVYGKRYYTLKTSKGYRERGIASWYGTKFHGRRTSSGEDYDMYAMTAAHKTLPLPTYVRVTNLENQRTVVLRVNDRGPFHTNRIIDLSYAAAWKLGILSKGTGYVEVEALDPRSPQPVTVAKSTPSPSAGPVQLYLQTGSFSVRANAEQMKWQMQSVSGGPVNIEPVQIDGKTTYRVRVGPIANVTKADRLAQQIADLGLETPRIVIE